MPGSLCRWWQPQSRARPLGEDVEPAFAEPATPRPTTCASTQRAPEGACRGSRRPTCLFTSSRSWGQGRPRERCCPGSRLSGDAQRVARAISVLGEGAEIAVAAGLASSTQRRSPPPRASSCARRSCAPSRRSASSTRWCRRPSIPTSHPGSVSCTTNARPRFSSGSALTEQIAAVNMACPHAARTGGSLVRSRVEAVAGDPDSAIASLRRALDEPPTPDLGATARARAGRGDDIAAGRTRAPSGRVRAGRRACCAGPSSRRPGPRADVHACPRQAAAIAGRVASAPGRAR